MTKIAAVIVTYNPDFEIIENTKALSGLVDHVYIYDNKSTSNNASGILECISTLDNVYVHLGTDNIGLAAAQNYLIKLIKDGFDWIITLDDDSKIYEDGFYNLKRELNKVDKKVGIIVPKIIDVNTKTASSFIKRDDIVTRTIPDESCSMKVLTAISSGMIIRKEVFDVVGFMNEKYFIDVIDTEFSLRVNDHYEIMYFPGYTLFHKLGCKTCIKIFSLNIFISNHSPFRRCYIYRNKVDLWKSRLPMNRGFVFFDMLQAIFDISKIVLFEGGKFNNIKNIIKGFWLGIKKHYGKIDFDC